MTVTDFLLLIIFSFMVGWLSYDIIEMIKTELYWYQLKKWAHKDMLERMELIKEYQKKYDL